MVIRHGQLATWADTLRFWFLDSRVDILTGNRCTDFGYDCSVRHSCSQVNAICEFLSFVVITFNLRSLCKPFVHLPKMFSCVLLFSKYKSLYV